MWTNQLPALDCEPGFSSSHAEDGVALVAFLVAAMIPVDF